MGCTKGGVALSPLPQYWLGLGFVLGQWWPRTELSKQEAEVKTVTVILSTMSSKTVEKFSHKPGIIKTKIINHKEERKN